jgi:glutathione synthase/RimK-type ligase-like ATP-grasp enzyme
VIVAVSHPDDPHAVRVLDVLRRAGHETLLFNLADLPAAATLTFDYGTNGDRPRLLFRTGGNEVDLGRARSAWWRRPQSPDLGAIGNPDVFNFTHQEWQEALNGLWQLVEAPWMNPPALDEVASRKAHQLRVARELGLRTPHTLVTSDPDAARGFIDAHGIGKTIFKTFSCTHAIWRETRLVRQEELGILDQVRLAPVIFQEYIPASADLRVTVINDRIFPAAIDSRGTDYEVDFRMSLGQARTEPCTLPREVEERLLALLERLHLVYGAIDLRRTPEGEHVFLEVNTGGEFLFIEERTGQPITQAVADWLANPRSRAGLLRESNRRRGSGRTPS